MIRFNWVESLFEREAQERLLPYANGSARTEFARPLPISQSVFPKHIIRNLADLHRNQVLAQYPRQRISTFQIGAIRTRTVGKPRAYQFSVRTGISSMTIPIG